MAEPTHRAAEAELLQAEVVVHPQAVAAVLLRAAVAVHPQVAVLQAALLQTAVAAVEHPQDAAPGAVVVPAARVELVAAAVVAAPVAVVVARLPVEAAEHLRAVARVAMVVRADLVAPVVPAEAAVVVARPQAVAAARLPLAYLSPRLAPYCWSASRPATCCVASARRDNLVAVKSTFY
jgi:hypothetical protein